MREVILDIIRNHLSYNSIEAYHYFQSMLNIKYPDKILVNI